jgi:hypothetical protein
MSDVASEDAQQIEVESPAPGVAAVVSIGDRVECGGIMPKDQIANSIRASRRSGEARTTRGVERVDDLLPPPGLLSAEIPNRGPVVDPPFVDVPDFSRYLKLPEAIPVDYEVAEPRVNDESRRLAAELVLDSERVMGRLQDKRYAVLEIGTRTVDRETEWPVVIIYNYTDDLVVEATIDPIRRAVNEVSEEYYQPPLADAELNEVLDIVASDASLSEAGVDIATGVGLIVEEVNFRSPRYRHRLVDLRFGPPTHYLPVAFAIVDLSARDIVNAGTICQDGQS